MSAIDPGRFDKIDNQEGSGVLQKFNSQAWSAVEGVTNVEVIEVLIDRIIFLNSISPCRENSLAITKLEEALMWLNKRTQNRIERGVEGKNEV